MRWAGEVVVAKFATVQNEGTQEVWGNAPGGVYIWSKEEEFICRINNLYYLKVKTMLFRCR